MRLSSLIRDNKPAVVERWYDQILSAYPVETVRLWKKGRDQFGNPVGATFTRCLGPLLDALMDWQDPAAIAAPLDEIVKIRAVQDMAPGKALAFIPAFKKILRELFGEAIVAQGLMDELAAYDARIDNLVLMAFDIYTKSREKLYEMRVQEFKNAHHMIFRKAGIMCETSRQALGLEDSNPSKGE